MRSRILFSCTLAVILAFSAAVPGAAEIALTGRVLRASDDGLAGAVVEIRPLLDADQAGRLSWSGAAGPAPVASTETDATGRFRLAVARAGIFTLSAAAPGQVRMEIRPLVVIDDRALPPVVLADDRGLTVRVRDLEGVPVAGARIFASGAELSPAGWRAAARRGQTGDDGRLRLPRQAGEALAMTAYVPGMIGRGTAAMGEDELDLQIATDGGRWLEARNSDGAPLAEVLVRDGETGWPLGISGADGRLRVPAAESETGFLHLSTTDGRRLRRPLPSAGREPWIVMLPAAAQVGGRVLDQTRRRPLAGALVWLAADPGHHVLSDVEGEYELPTPGFKHYRLGAGAAGYQRRSVRVAAGRAAGARAPDLELTPSVAVALYGRVVDEEEWPIAGAEVRLTRYGSPADPFWRLKLKPGRRMTARTDPEGRFRLLDLRPGGVAIEVRAEGFVAAETRDLELAEKDVGPLLFVLERGASLEGRVSTESGEPLAGVRIQAKDGGDWSDEGGAYRVDGIALGWAELEAFHPDYEPLTERMEIVTGVNSLDFILTDGQEVSGRVLDTSGLPVADAALVLSLESDADSRTYYSESTPGGEFRFFPVADGIYRLRATKTGFAAAEAAETVEVAGAPLDGLEVALTAGAAVTGRIIGLDPGELGDLVVHAVDELGRTYTGRVEAWGEYEIADLLPGEWRLEAKVDGGRRETGAAVLIPPGTARNRRDLEFGSGWRLYGVVRFGQRPLRGAHVELRGISHAVRRSARTDPRGEFLLEDLSAGTYLVALSEPRELLVHRQTLELHSDRRVVFELGGARVAGRVFDSAGGQPLSGAVVDLERANEGEPGALMSVATDVDGIFELPRVQPGRYRLTARKDGYSPAHESLEVESGQDRTDLRLRLSASSPYDSDPLGVDPPPDQTPASE